MNFKILKDDNLSLKCKPNKWKNKFLKIINFIKNRLSRWHDKEKYQEFSIDLYEHGAIDKETLDNI
ncbi:MAG: hypothetical protein RR255_02235 [Bacilli bacterium]